MEITFSANHTHIMKKFFVAALLLALTAGACEMQEKIDEIERETTYHEHKPVVMKEINFISADGSWPESVTFDEGWDEVTSQAFWFTSQGHV